MVPQLLVEVRRRRRRRVLGRVVEGLHAVHGKVLAAHKHVSTAHHGAGEGRGEALVSTTVVKV